MTVTILVDWRCRSWRFGAIDPDLDFIYAAGNDSSVTFVPFSKY